MDRRVLAALLAVIVIGGAFYLSRPKGPRTLTGLEIAEKTMGFIESLHTEGGYLIGKSCTNDGNLSDCYASGGPVIDGSNLPVLANLAMSDAAGNPAYRETAEEVFQATFRKCKELGNCEDAIPLLSEYYLRTKEDAYLDSLSGVSGTLIGVFDDEWERIWGQIKNDSPVVVFDTPIFLMIVEHLADAYAATKDPKLLDEARLLVGRMASGEHGVRYYSDGFPVSYTSCDVQLAKMELYGITEDPQYLSQLEEFFSRAEITKNLNQFEALGDFLMCAEVLVRLYGTTGKPGYAKDAKDIVQHIITGYWDSEMNKKFNGDGGFLSIRWGELATGTESMKGNEKRAELSSRMVIVLSRLGKEKFEVA